MSKNEVRILAEPVLQEVISLTNVVATVSHLTGGTADIQKARRDLELQLLTRIKELTSAPTQ